MTKSKYQIPTSFWVVHSNAVLLCKSDWFLVVNRSQVAMYRVCITYLSWFKLNYILRFFSVRIVIRYMLITYGRLQSPIDRKLANPAIHKTRWTDASITFGHLPIITIFYNALSIMSLEYYNSLPQIITCISILHIKS